MSLLSGHLGELALEERLSLVLVGLHGLEVLGGFFEGPAEEQGHFKF